MTVHLCAVANAPKIPSSAEAIAEERVRELIEQGAVLHMAKTTVPANLLSKRMSGVALDLQNKPSPIVPGDTIVVAVVKGDSLDYVTWRA